MIDIRMDDKPSKKVDNLHKESYNSSINDAAHKVFNK